MNESNPRIISHLCILAFGFFIGWTIGHRRQPDAVNNISALTQKSETVTIQPSKKAQIDPPIDRVMPNANATPRQARVEQRERTAPIDARNIIERRKEQYWAKLRDLGMSITQFDQFMDKASESLSLSFIAEASLFDQIDAQIKTRQFLESVLSTTAVTEFKEYDLALPARERIAQLAMLGENKGVEISEENAEVLQRILSSSGTLPQTFGGAFDEAKIPTVGRYASEIRRQRELALLETQYNIMLSEARDKLPEDLVTLFHEDINTRLTKLREPHPDLAAVAAGAKLKILEEMKKRAAPVKP